MFSAWRAPQNLARLYEAEAVRSGWTVCQLDRQIASQFYERTALSNDKAAIVSDSQIEAGRGRGVDLHRPPHLTTN
jgi:predicted nuclease of restriction endonuclease-like (RecB) superfamily